MFFFSLSLSLQVVGLRIWDGFVRSSPKKRDASFGNGALFWLRVSVVELDDDGLEK